MKSMPLVRDAMTALCSIAALLLVSGVAHANTLDLGLERSSDLRNWERLPVDLDTVTGGGKVRVPAGDTSEFFRLRVQNSEDEPVSDGFVRIPAGAYARGDHLNEAESWMARSRPVHGVYVSDFLMADTPVTYGDWKEVHGWAVANGYSFDNVGQRGCDSVFEPLPPSPENDLHPVVQINWYDMVKWCNARSEMEGLRVVYYIDDNRTSIYRTGRRDLSNGQVDWAANGYRLPTSAEWERAARGGREGSRWPWGDEAIDQARANYRDGSVAVGTTRAGSYPPNPYGLYDMAGNVWERCWDWFADGYGEAGAPELNTRGPDSGLYRVARGGSWNFDPKYCRTGYYGGSAPDTRGRSWGFRVVRTTSVDR